VPVHSREEGRAFQRGEKGVGKGTEKGGKRRPRTTRKTLRKRERENGESGNRKGKTGTSFSPEKVPYYICRGRKEGGKVGKQKIRIKKCNALHRRKRPKNWKKREGKRVTLAGGTSSLADRRKEKKKG